MKTTQTWQERKPDVRSGPRTNLRTGPLIISAVKQRNTVIQASLGAMAATVVADRDGSAASRFPAWLRRCQASGLARLEGRASASVSDCT
jgi:hypothetical protein